MLRQASEQSARVEIVFKNKNEAFLDEPTPVVQLESPRDDKKDAKPRKRRKFKRKRSKKRAENKSDFDATLAGEGASVLDGTIE